MHWKTRGRLAGISVLILGVLSAHVDARNAFAEDRPPDVWSSEPALRLARVSAQHHLDRFFAHAVTVDGSSMPGAALLVVQKAADGGERAVWLAPFELTQNGLRGRPAGTTGGTTDETVVHAARNDIVDWTYWGDDGALYGSFASRFLLPHTRPDKTAGASAILSDSPIPADWQDFHQPHDFSLADAPPSL